MRPPADPSHGSGENQPTMDSGRSPLLPLAACTMLILLRATEAGSSFATWRRQLREAERQWGGKLVDEAADQTG
jgi:hypothetical protein